MLYIVYVGPYPGFTAGRKEQDYGDYYELMEIRKKQRGGYSSGGRLQRGDKASRVPYKMDYGDAMRIQ